jgi:predicted RNA binding protein YcfA (HicA-like mRNA interferase family)
MMERLNIMLRQVNFDQLERVLFSLGFEENKVAGSHTKFVNSQANALIVLPIHHEFRLPHIRMIEKVLEERGIASREEFEDLISDAEEISWAKAKAA